ncbi:MAG: hypothetical protein ACWGQW_25740 [bacterium]
MSTQAPQAGVGASSKSELTRQPKVSSVSRDAEEQFALVVLQKTIAKLLSMDDPIFTLKVLPQELGDVLKREIRREYDAMS